MLSAALGYAAFALLALIGPGLALLRLARVRLDPALVLPLGLSTCAGAYWLSLTLQLPWLFVLIVAALDAALLASLRGWPRADGPGLAGALPPLLALVAAFALMEYPLNRVGERGEFVFDNVVPEDTAFHVALAFELTVATPPQVPGLSGVPMGYHIGLPLVRAAALRWARVHPFDQMSRFEITLVAFGLILALRGITRRLGGGPAAVALVGFTLLATDFSFLFAGSSFSGAWLYLTDANLIFSLAHANSSVAATLIALAALIAVGRHLAGEGRGYFVLALLLAAALPHFKAFVAAEYLLGLGVAALLTRRLKEPAALAAPALVSLGLIVLGRASQEMEIGLDPLAIARRMAENLGAHPAGVPRLLLWGAIWTLASLGLRVFGLPAAVRALRSGALPAAALAAMALAGWPIGMLFRVMPLDYEGWRRPYNEAWYFIEQSGPLLWIFTVLALTGLSLRGWRRGVLGAACAALALPSTVQFVSVKRATPPGNIPPAIVEAMGALEEASRPGDVVLEKPEPKRYPPPPMALIGRRVPFARYIPYLYQVAPRRLLLERLETVRRFFKTTDPREAVGVARSLHARFLCLFGDDAVAFDPAGVLRPIFERSNVRVYEILGVDGGAEATPGPRR